VANGEEAIATRHSCFNKPGRLAGLVVALRYGAPIKFFSFA
jgi:hypothetical protein